ncbi:MAG: PKD domain-containing protein, partial [Solirubrobacteraceae bacterium]
MSLIRALVVPAALLVLLLAAAAARATTDTVVGFDDLSSGTVVTDQYRADGARLGTAAGLGSPSTGNGDCGSPTVGTGTVPAHSGSNYATLAACALPGAGPPQYYAGTFVALVDFPSGSVGVQVRSLAGSGAPVPMSITGYDSRGGAVATGSADAVPGSWTPLLASQAGGPVPAQISWVLIATSTAAGAAPQIAIDDLGFDQAGATLTATGVAVTAVAGTPFSGTVATIADGDLTATAPDFSARIDWGDGSSSAATITAAPTAGSFTVSGAHTWSSAGSYPVQVAVSKVNGRTASASSTASVTGTAGAGPGGGGGGSAPSASLALTAPNPVAGQPVGLTGAGSQPGQGQTIVSYGWDFNGDGHIDTSTGTNPVASFQFTPGVHTVALTVTDSGGGQSTSRLTIAVGAPPANLIVPDGGQGPCEPTYDDGDVHIVAECIQTLAGGGHVIQTRLLDLNGMTLAPRAGGEGVFKILPFNHLGIGNGTQLSGPAVNLELLNTPIGDLVLGGVDLTSAPIQLSFHAFVPPKVLRFAQTAGANDSKTLIVSLGAGHSCSGGSKDPSCCPKPGPTTACATLPGSFPITGQVNVYLNGKGQVLLDVQVGLDLQAVNFQATGALEIVADLQTGINLNSLQFTIPQAGLASIFEVKDASFTYYWPSDPDASKRDTWQAKAT